MTIMLIKMGDLGYGKVEKEITSSQPGRIKFQGTHWKAKLAVSDSRSIASGERVRVVGRQGIGLLVVPEDYEFPTQCRKRPR